MINIDILETSLSFLSDAAFENVAQNVLYAVQL